MRKSFRCYVNQPLFDKTETGQRKVWRTDGKRTHLCSLEAYYFIWEKSTRHNNYEGYTGYVEPRRVEFIDVPKEA